MSEQKKVVSTMSQDEFVDQFTARLLSTADQAVLATQGAHEAVALALLGAAVSYLLRHSPPEQVAELLDHAAGKLRAELHTTSH